MWMHRYIGLAWWIFTKISFRDDHYTKRFVRFVSLNHFNLELRECSRENIC